MKIAIIGKIRSGKDTVATLINEMHPSTILGFGDSIGECIETYFPEKYAQGKQRTLYQKIGQWFREIDPKVWVKSLDRKLEQLEKQGVQNIIVKDLRQPNEYRYLKQKGFTVIKVEAPTQQRLERAIASGDRFTIGDLEHETEMLVDTVPYDYSVRNDGNQSNLIGIIESMDRLGVFK